MPKILLHLLCLSLLAPSVSLLRAGEGKSAPGNQLYARCINCHGPNAQGMQLGPLRVPSIAGLDAWYIEVTLNKFRTDARGAHPDDTKGLLMRAMARSLANGDEVKAVADYIAKLPKKNDMEPLDGNVQRGQQLYSMVCMACHGATSQGNSDPNIHAPSQLGLEAWYIEEQLAKFRNGVRGGVKDMDGLRMAPMVRDALPAMAKSQGISTDQADRDIIAYIRSLRVAAAK